MYRVKSFGLRRADNVAFVQDQIFRGFKNVGDLFDVCVVDHVMKINYLHDCIGKFGNMNRF